MRSQGALGCYRCRYRIGGTGKGHEEGIPLRIHLEPMVLLESSTQQLLTLRQHNSIAIAYLL
jgi:hypothetical protein